MGSRRSNPIVFKGTARLVRNVLYPRDVGEDIYIRVTPEIVLALRITEFNLGDIDESTITFIGQAKGLEEG